MAVYSSQQLLQQEKDYLQEVSTKCRYLMWVLNVLKTKNSLQLNSIINNNIGTQKNNITASYCRKKTYMVVLFTKDLSKSLKNACGKHGIHIYIKGGKTINNFLVAPKDTDPIIKNVDDIQIQV